MKKTLSIVLALVMLLTMLPTFAITAFADDQGQCGYESLEKMNWKYSSTTNTLTINTTENGIHMQMYTYEGGAPWYKYKDEIKKVNILNGASVGKYAFSGLTSLETVTLSSNVTDIFEYAFYGCTSLKAIKLPSGIKGIYAHAFENTGLTELIVPNSVTYIDSTGFTGIDKIFYTGSLADAPWGASELGDINSAGKNLVWSVTDDTLTITGTGSMCDWNKANGYTAPWTAMPYKNTVEKLVIGEGITDIGNEAFQEMFNLASVQLPSTVTEIGARAFRETYVGSINLPTSLTTIGEEAFAFLIDEKVELTVPCSVTTIGADAFKSCHNNVHYSGTAAGAPWDTSSDPIAIVPNDSESGHIAEKVNAVDATCTSTGLTEGSQCSVCKKVLVAQATTKILDHNYVNGACSACGATQPTPAPQQTSTGSNTTSSTTNTATDSTPAPAPADTAPAVETIKFGTETLLPNAQGEYVSKKAKKPALSKVAAGKKSFTASWKAIKGVAGYQVQYATDSKFKKNKKSVTVKKAKTVKTTVKKLSAKKKYYVRIRTYTTVKANGKTYKVYSGWSKAKTVTTKK